MDPLQTSSYRFHLPSELIAAQPAQPRDHARLLVYDRQTDTITHTRFYEIEKYLPNDCALLFNDTKVIKARLYGQKSSGGKIELLINRSLDAYRVNVFIRGRVKTGTVLTFEEGLRAEITALREDASRDVIFSLSGEQIRFETLLGVIDNIGHIPLPPYMEREDSESDSTDYQTVFAAHEGAVAAPTASLHFSDALFKRICKHHKHAFLTLHVGAGTFKPVESEIITDHPMHSEYYSISNDALEIIASKQPLLCVGTTSTRTVEYYVRTCKRSGEANLFLHPNNPPRRADHLLTNFHLPQSTLLMLVASFVGIKTTHRLYEEAIREKYRFYSYGDAMLII